MLCEPVSLLPIVLCLYSPVLFLISSQEGTDEAGQVPKRFRDTLLQMCGGEALPAVPQRLPPRTIRAEEITSTAALSAELFLYTFDRRYQQESFEKLIHWMTQ